MYDYAMRFTDYLINGFKMAISLPNGFTFSWYEVYAFEIICSIVISVIAGILYED